MEQQQPVSSGGQTDAASSSSSPSPSPPPPLPSTNGQLSPSTPLGSPQQPPSIGALDMLNMKQPSPYENSTSPMSGGPATGLTTPVTSSHGDNGSPSPPMLPLSLAASVASKVPYGALSASSISSMVPSMYKALEQHHHHHHHHRPSVYNSPPQSTGGGGGGGGSIGGHCDPSANECKLIDYRGAKVAAFIVNGETLLCLPQAFELFLKHLVGGLHTVYTKLKRLDITPIVCNVEQVRILRGLGSIQPGVNRCKLLSCNAFDTLYKDCTTASSRPGRPPKRASLIDGMSPTHPSDSAIMKAKKCRIDNGDYLGYENGHITAEFLRAAEQLEKNPLLANGYSHHAAAQVAAAAAHINSLPFIPISSHHGVHGGGHHHHHQGGGGGGASSLLSPSALSNSSHPNHHHHHHHLSGLLPTTRRSNDVTSNKDHRSAISSAIDAINSSRSKEERCESSDKERLYSSPASYEHHRIKDSTFANGSTNGHSSVLNLSQNNRNHGGGNGGTEHSGSEAAFNDVGEDDEDENDTEEEDDDDREHDLSDNPDVSSTGLVDKGSSNGQAVGMLNNMPGMGTMTAESLGISSIETLLRNIQGLLKVAADNARQQERQSNYEKAELKMELLREREIREGLEKQLLEEQRIRVLYQKRIKKEKRTKRRLQEELEVENNRRCQYEEALRNTSSETLRILNESLAHDIERDRNNSRNEQERKIQDSFYKPFTTT